MMLWSWTRGQPYIWVNNPKFVKISLVLSNLHKRCWFSLKSYCIGLSCVRRFWRDFARIFRSYGMWPDCGHFQLHTHFWPLDCIVYCSYMLLIVNHEDHYFKFQHWICEIIFFCKGSKWSLFRFEQSQEPFLFCEVSNYK